MSNQTKIALIVAILLWASAFAGIRAGLQGYSPEGLALLRYIIASFCMSIVYFRLPERQAISWVDKFSLAVIGVIGIGIYSLTLNYGELVVSSGTASFVVSQSPIITAIFAVLFLRERLNLPRVLGFLVSVAGVILIAVGEKGGFSWDDSLTYILIATVMSGLYSVLQKPFLKKYHVIQVTTYIIWGGTLFLVFYFPKLQYDLGQASLSATLAVVYLGIFPGALGYVAWSYVLAHIPASRAVSFFYFMPFLSMLLGWIWLGEVPVWLSVAGGLLAIFGVWLVNDSYAKTRLLMFRSN